jgi:hypothetical protein
MMLRYLRIGLVVAAMVLVVVACAASPLTPEDGRQELLWAPLWLGLPLLLVAWSADHMARSSESSGTSVVATVGLGLVIGIAMFRLAEAFFTPAAARDPDIWHLWPLFTLIWVAVGSAVTLGATLFASAVARWREKAGGMK